MDWTIELVVVPVTDVDRAKAFYIDEIGFEQLVDVTVGAGMRVVQLTPHGSACAIALTGDSPMAAGTLHGLHVVVPDIERARAELVGRGVEVSDFFHFGPEGQTDGPDPERRNYNTYVSFQDPDGNTWLIQEVNRARAGS